MISIMKKDLLGNSEHQKIEERHNFIVFSIDSSSKAVKLSIENLMDDSEEIVTKEYQLDCREESKKWQFVEFLN